MATRKDFADALIEVGRAALPLAVPGAAAGLKAVETVIDLIDKSDAVIEHKPAELVEIREQLHERVNAHVDRTVDRLRNGD